MNKIFIIEDDAERIKWFRRNFKHCDLTIAESVTEAIEKFKPPYTLIFLDHDLGGRQFVDSQDTNTGYEFLRYILGYYDFSYTDWIIHSHNPTGAHNMEMFLMKHVEINTVHTIPFSNLIEMWNLGQITICGKKRGE